MSRDPMDDLGAHLFQVAREEPPPDGAAQRALEAARGATASSPTSLPLLSRAVRPRLLLWAAAFAALVAGASFLRREQPSGAISPEPSDAPRRARERAPISAVPTASAAATSEVKAAPRVVPTPARSAPLSLSDEIEILKVAETALGSGNTEAALKALDRYDHTLKGNKQLRAEATLLRIETLSRAGKLEVADELARRFVDQNPTSPLVDRARSFVDSEGKR